MKTRMKDDESLMLGLSQQAGYLVAPEGMNLDRSAMIARKWYAAGWLDEDRETLSDKGLTIKGGRSPEVVARVVCQEQDTPVDPDIVVGEQGFTIDLT